MSQAPPVSPARHATPEDNDALLALTEQCPMEGDIGLCVGRRPDFFALNRLEGDRWWVGVVDAGDRTAVGCVAVAERMVYLHGRPTRSMYVSDLKVHPDYRGSGAADMLSVYARELVGNDGVPTFLTILAGNKSREKRLSGPRGLPQVHRFATLRSHSVSLLWRRRIPSYDGDVSRGQPGDLEEMADVWQRVAPQRQFAPVLDAQSLTRWIDAAPALDLSSYLLARDRSGRIVGFLAFWDQESFKQMRVTSYSRKLAGVRTLLNAGAPIVGATPLPPAGGSLRYVTAVHVCVPGDRPDVLRALLLHAYGELRGTGYSFLTIGLDVRDPLTKALSGLLAQPTDIWACAATSDGGFTGTGLTDRPVHHEIALV